jgi:hypothetical protein
MTLLFVIIDHDGIRPGLLPNAPVAMEHDIDRAEE